MERLLVTGFDRPLGGNLALALADRYQVLALSSEDFVESPGLECALGRATDPEALEEWVHRWRPQWLIHCPALSASAWDAVDDDAADESDSVARLVRATAKTSTRLTVVVSDAVYAGPRLFQEETREPAGTSPRAAAQRSLERTLLAAGALVVRTHAYGWSPASPAAGFAQRTYEALLAGKTPVADGRRYATPILATDLAEALHRGHEHGLEGLYHMAGAERTSPWGFAAALAAALGVHMPLARPALPIGDAAECHEETSLDSKRARRILETPTPMLREGLYRFVAQDQNGWRDRWLVSGQATQRAA